MVELGCFVDLRVAREISCVGPSDVVSGVEIMGSVCRGGVGGVVLIAGAVNNISCC